MYSRPPDHTRNRIKIPDNYNGNAFGGVNDLSSRYSDLKEEAFAQDREKDDILAPLKEAPVVEAVRTVENEINGAKSPTELSALQPTKSSSLASLLPTFIGSSSHFPFGHGIGQEELLILAMMAMIFMSDGETDNEMILLLGLLLFAG